MKKFFLLSVLFFCVEIVSAQHPNHFRLESNFQLGRIVSNNTVFPEIKSNAFAYELNCKDYSNRRQDWESVWPYAERGISFHYINIGNNDVLGKAFAISPNLKLAFKNGKHFNLTLSEGYAFVTKHSQNQGNKENNVIGSHFNFFDEAKLHYDFMNGHAHFAFTVLHMSNGRLKVPDLGINIPFIEFGVTNFNVYYGKFKRGISTTLLPELNKKLLFSLRFGVGKHEVIYSDGPLFTDYTMTLAINKRLSYKVKVGAGLHIAYGKGVYVYALAQEIISKKESQHKSFRFAVPVANCEIFVGRVSLLMEGGIYLTHYYLSGGRYYTKFGFQYYVRKPTIRLKKNLSVGLLVQANFGNAEFPELAVGWNF